MYKHLVRLIPLVGLLLALWPNGALAGSDQLVTDLRVDLPEVYNSHDYETLIWTQVGYPGPDGYTTGFLGVDTAQYNGQTFSAGFTQVGLLNDQAGVHWFFFSEAGSFDGVHCQRYGATALRWPGMDSAASVPSATWG